MDLEALGKELLATGRFMGLVTKSGDSIGVNTDWFASPTARLGDSHKRFDALVELMGLVLKDKAKSPPQVFPKAQWHPIFNPRTRKLTPFHLVVPDGESNGEIGLGVLQSTGVGKLTVTAYAYVPLAAFSKAGSEFIAAAKPFKIAVEVHSPDEFGVGDFRFSRAAIETEILLSGEPPKFQLVFEGQQTFTFTTLEEILDTGKKISVLDCLDVLLLDASYWLNSYIGDSGYTIGGILAGAGFLEEMEESTDYKVARESLEEMRTKSALEIALGFLFAALDALSEREEPLVELPGGGAWIARRDNEYGLRLSAKMPLVAGGAAGGKKTPSIDLCLGQPLAGDKGDDNWVKRCGGDAGEPGLFLMLLRKDGDRLAFTHTFDLSGVGIDVSGPGDLPLFNLGGYTLKSAQLRTHAKFGDVKELGFAIFLDEVGFPIGPSFEASQKHGGNAVAKNILASGEAEPDADSKDTVNPSFSATACYVAGKDALLERFDKDGANTDLIWFPMQRRFGPLDCKKVGLRLDITGKHKEDPILGFVFDGGVKLPALDVRLDELAFNAHLKRIADLSSYELDLQGLGIAFDSGPVSVGAGLFKVKEEDGSTAYDGEALMRFKDLTIAAIGSFSSPIGIGTSMFLFAMTSKPLGGPAFFFVTGLAAGFGYNRGLRIPDMDEVPKFPLVSCIGGPALELNKALGALREGNWVPPARGEYWLAAGVRFTTFRILDTQAVLIIQFGKELIISVLGISTLKQPSTGPAYFYAKLGLRAVFRPSAGEFMASAVLAPGSYVFTEEAHLSGGFALGAWFDPSPHAGDFVYTIGGYHPAFMPPDHYPQVPRVGINWMISDNIKMLGEAYFAITPSAMMAGGALQVTLDAGPLQAWLKARLDALVYWKPFYVMVDVAVSIGVSFHIHLLFVDETISAEIGCNFSFWGPEVGFSVHVDWYIVSFTIDGGASRGQRDPLTWSTFKELLPANDSARVSQHHAMNRIVPGGDFNNVPPVPTPAQSGYLSITANEDGLLRMYNLRDDLALWLVRPGSFRFTAKSAAPSTKIEFHGEGGAKDEVEGLAVAPRHLAGTYQSTYAITILNIGSPDDADTIAACFVAECGTQPSGCDKPAISLRDWQKTSLADRLPRAMWRRQDETSADVDVNEISTMMATVGAVMNPLPPALTNCSPQMAIADVFADRTIFAAADEWWLPISRATLPVDTNSRPAASFLSIAEIDSPKVAARRAGLIFALKDSGYEGFSSAAMKAMAANPGLDFADEPREGSPVGKKAAA